MIDGHEWPEGFHVAPEKVVEYLLNSHHPIGGLKTPVYLARGFSLARWEGLLHALLVHAKEARRAKVVENTRGVKFVFEGPLRTPNNLPLHLRTVWQVDHGDTVARFITATPLDRASTR